MVRTIQRPVAHERVGEPSAGPLQRVQGLAGVAILTLAATTLGLPLSGGHLATDLLLVILGYKMTTRLRQGQYEDRNVVRFWLGHLGRVGVPMLVALGLTVTYWSWTGAVTATQQEAVLRALTLSLNTMEHSANGDIEAINHLRLVALISQFALVLPALLFVFRKVPGKARAGLLCAIGATAAIGRIALLTSTTGMEDARLLTQLLRVDALVIGAAIAFAPLPILRRVIPVRYAPLLFVGLLLCFLAAPGAAASGPVIGIAAWTSMSLSIALVASAAGGGLIGALATVVDSEHMKWLGGRVLSILIWHPFIGYIFNGNSAAAAESGTATEMNSWPGFLVFALRMTFTLAAAATSYRYLALPLASLARQLTLGPRQKTAPQAEQAETTAQVKTADQMAASEAYRRSVSNHPAVRPLRLSREAHPSLVETR